MMFRVGGASSCYSLGMVPNALVMSHFNFENIEYLLQKRLYMKQAILTQLYLLMIQQFPRA